MRIESVKKAGKIAGRIYDYSGLAFKATVSAGMLAVIILSQGTLVPQNEASPIEQFLLENPEESVKAPLEAPKKTPKASPSKPQKQKTKKINLRVAKACHQYDTLVRKYFGKEKFLLRKAQMHKESSCDHFALGKAGEKGLFQLKEEACIDVGVSGDLFDPETNARCASLYLKHLCTVYGHCEDVPQLVAYNEGPSGIKKVRDIFAHAYPQGIFKILGLA